MIKCKYSKKCIHYDSPDYYKFCLRCEHSEDNHKTDCFKEKDLNT